MSKIALAPNASGTGTLSIASPNTNSDYTLTLPAETGTVLTSGGAIDVNASAPADSLAISSAGNVGIGTTSPTTLLDLYSASGVQLRLANSTTGTATGDGSRIYLSGSDLLLVNRESATMQFYTADTERMRIDSSGKLCVNTTSGEATVHVVATSGTSPLLLRVGTNGDWGINFRNASNTTVGSVTVNSSSTAYNTSSDYRLKENIAPMTGALATVAQLNPVIYNWKIDGSVGQGFIAHELQAVVPDCVTGEKDAVETYVDEEGVEQTRPVYQGIDTSFLVATLTAAIKELSAKNDALEARIAALEGAANVPA